MLRCDYKHETRTYKYECKDNSLKGFFVDVVEIDHKMYEVYLFHKDYSTKDLMFGVCCKDVTYPDLLDMIGANIEEYIQGYIDDYFD